MANGFVRTAHGAIAIALLLLRPGSGTAATTPIPLAHSPRVIRLRLDIPLSRPSSTDEQDIGDTSSVFFPDSMSLKQILDSDRYFAHFPAERAAQIDGHTRRLEFWLTTPAATAEFALRILSDRVWRQFRAQKTPRHDQVVVRWDLRDSTGVRIPHGGYVVVVDGKSGQELGGTLGIVRVRP